MNGKIRHSGVIDSMTEGCVRVRILQTSACSACKVAGHCHASEAKEKLVDVHTDHGAAFEIGQPVVVTASRQMAAQATLFGFGIPLLVLIVVLVSVLGVTGSESVAALSALGALVPYYLVLWLFRERMGRSISFQIEEEKKN